MQVLYKQVFPNSGPPPPEMLVLLTQYKHFWSYPKKDDLKNEDDLKKEDNLKKEDDLKNEDYLKNEADLKIKDDLKNWPIPQ